MAEDTGANEQLALIRSVLAGELERQQVGGVDIDRLAEAVGAVLEAQPAVARPVEGKRPEELNATNDD